MEEEQLAVEPNVEEDVDNDLKVVEPQEQEQEQVLTDDDQE